MDVSAVVQMIQAAMIPVGLIGGGVLMLLAAIRIFASTRKSL